MPERWWEMLTTLKNGQSKSSRQAFKSDIRIPVASGRPGSLDNLLHEMMSPFDPRLVFILLAVCSAASIFTGEKRTESLSPYQFIQMLVISRSLLSPFRCS